MLKHCSPLLKMFLAVSGEFVNTPRRPTLPGLPRRSDITVLLQLPKSPIERCLVNLGVGKCVILQVCTEIIATRSSLFLQKKQNYRLYKAVEVAHATGTGVINAMARTYFSSQLNPPQDAPCNVNGRARSALSFHAFAFHSRCNKLLDAITSKECARVEDSALDAGSAVTDITEDLGLHTRWPILIRQQRYYLVRVCYHPLDVTYIYSFGRVAGLRRPPSWRRQSALEGRLTHENCRSNNWIAWTSTLAIARDLHS